jgi:peptidoglycan LD-endopeptidase CwlK
MDTTTIDKISKLHPSVRAEVKKIIEECDKALTGKAKVRITQGLRTFKEQDGLYNLGRTVANSVGKTPKKPLGNIVTNAKGGKSIHNYGFAVDICLIIDGKVASWDTAKDWDNDRIADWYECVKIFIKNGWEWGGNWKKFKDLPHFDKRGFGSWQSLSKLKLDKEGYVILK